MGCFPMTVGHPRTSLDLISRCRPGQHPRKLSPWWGKRHVEAVLAAQASCQQVQHRTLQLHGSCEVLRAKHRAQRAMESTGFWMFISYFKPFKGSI